MLHLNFTPFPVLETERLFLRQLRSTDRGALFDLRSNPVIMQYIARPLAKTLEDADSVISMINDFIQKNEKINWAITEKENDRLIGVMGYVQFKQENYRAEIGYMTHPDYWGKGFAKEALDAALDYGFSTVGLHSVEAVIRPENLASTKLVEKAGFVREAYFKDYLFGDNRFWDATVYSLIRS